MEDWARPGYPFFMQDAQLCHTATPQAANQKPSHAMDNLGLGLDLVNLLRSPERASVPKHSRVTRVAKATLQLGPSTSLLQLDGNF